MSQFKPHRPTVAYAVASAAMMKAVDHDSWARHARMRRLAAKRQNLNKIARKIRKRNRSKS